MSNLAIKSLLGLVICAIALTGGLLPLLIRNAQQERSRRFIFCGEYFSRGIFFGGGIIHMLPDAIRGFANAMPNETYPVVMAICAFTIYFLQFIEQGLSQLFKIKDHQILTWSAYLLTIMISIHSIILGAALGVEETLASIIVVFFAIIAHKGAEAFALGINLRSSNMSYERAIKVIAIFSLMTPFGILLGSWLQNFLHANTGHIVESIFQAIAAGTFIYIASFNHIDTNDHHPSPVSKLMRIHSLGLGILLMALLAIWI